MDQIIKACIFDLDGVIVDTAEYHYLSWKKLSDQLGFDFSETDNHKLRGISRRDSLDIVLGIGGVLVTDQEKEDMCVLKNDWYLEYIKELTKDDLLPGVDELIKELKLHGVKIALGSASKNARTVLKALDITDQFDAIVDGTDVKHSKPDPEVFLQAAAQLGEKPAHCLVFEDAEKGIDAARAGGFHCIGIGETDRLGHADLVLSDLSNFNHNNIQSLFTEISANS